MQYFEASLLSMVLMVAIFFDVLRFPLLSKDRGSRFFKEMTIFYSICLIISTLVCLGREGILFYPLGLDRMLWTLHFLSFPFLLAMWMHFSAINVMDNEKLVTILTFIHLIPLMVLTILAVADIPIQRFYPLTATYEHLLPVGGTYFMMILSVFYCFAMILPTIGHRKELQGSFLFLSMLMPLTFLVSLATFWVTHSYTQFVMVNSFMMVLYYLVGQRDSVRTDALTGLATYALLQRKLIRVFRFQASYSVILLDIENFQYFNSRYGQSTGDALLLQISEFLRTLGNASEVFRIANDQFCLCIPAKNTEVVDCVSKKIKNRMNQIWNLEGSGVFVQVNLAVINIPEQAATLEEFKLATDQLFLEIKALRKKPMIVYTREISADYQRKLNVISSLRDSLRYPEQVQVYYQPIYEVNTNQLISAEALMRIEDRHLGFLQPGEFIPLAEQTGLIVNLTPIILAKVCKFIKKLPESVQGLEYISVNLSGVDLDSRRIGKTLLEVMEREGVDKKQIGFEITESVVLQSYEMVSEIMGELSLHKISFALDDFGSGYANLSALMDLPFDYVKLDKSVIDRITSNPIMLSLLTEMLHTLDKCIIAEGVETEEQLTLIKQMGIERVQGFYYSRPLNEGQFLELLGETRSVKS